MKVTIDQIAAMAGVARSTVSRALSPDHQRVSAETRRRVLDIAKSMNYMPSGPARLLARRKTGTVGFYWNHGEIRTTHSPSLSGLLAGSSMLLTERRHNLLLALGNSDDASSARIINERFVDGMIIGFDEDEPVMSRLRDNGIPFVLAQTRVCDDCDCVTVDDEDAAGSCVKYLAELGHRCIAYVNNDVVWHAASMEARAMGYVKAMAHLGLRTPDGYDRIEPIEQRIEELTTGVHTPTAVVCYDDGAAFSTIQILQERGFRVPDDISVIGFNDSEKASCSAVPITSASLPLVNIGRCAAGMLLDRIADPEIPVRQRKMKAELVVRASTAKAPRTAKGDR